MAEGTEVQAGYGLIQISDRVMPDLLNLSSYTVKDGRVSFSVSFRELAARLYLPENYEIEGVFFDVERKLYALLVRSDAIPVVPDFALLPLVVLTFYRHDDRTVSLAKIEIQER